MNNSGNRTPVRTQQRRRNWFLRTLLRSVLVIFLVMTAVFFLIRLVPGDPAVMVLGEHADPGALEKLRHQMGLDLSTGQQFVHFLRNVLLHGDTGESIKYGVSSRSLVLRYAPVTLLLVLLSLAVTIVVSILLAFLAATHKDSIFDQIVRIIPTFTQGMPVFWIGLIFILLFAVRLHWFPVGGIGKGPGGMIHSLILPAITISFGQIPPLVRSLREQLLEVLNADFVLTLRAAQVPRRRILWGHVLRNAFVPALMILGVNVSYLIGGTLVIEQVFAVRGIGALLFEAISNRDFPLVQAIALYCAVFVVLISFVIELIAHAVDPRTRQA